MSSDSVLRQSSFRSGRHVILRSSFVPGGGAVGVRVRCRARPCCPRSRLGTRLGQNIVSGRGRGACEKGERTFISLFRRGHGTAG